MRVRQFLDALDAIETEIRVIVDWKEELRSEIDLREKAVANDRSRLAEYRAGNWNIYVLGAIAQELAPLLEAEHIDADPTCYTYGRRPDTILNLGLAHKPEYLEINHNGRLNLKLSLEGKHDADRAECARQARDRWRQVGFDAAVDLQVHEGGRIGKSKTLLSFGVGLAEREDALELTQPRDAAIGRIACIARAFWDSLEAP